MDAETQYRLNAADLTLILAMVRTGKLADASERLGVDASTVFRSLRKIERGLGAVLFERSRSGYLATQLALTLADQGEQVESAVEEARSKAQQAPGQVSGAVRITTTDTILHGLLAPALHALQRQHPLLTYSLHTGNELASLSSRDADIALRATKKPPAHLVGRRVGPVRVALYTANERGNTMDEVTAGAVRWISVDEALPEHPSVVWRKRHYPNIVPAYMVNSIDSVMEMVRLGLGVGILPMFLAGREPGVRALSGELEDCQTELWLLTYPESRHLHRIATVYRHLAQHLLLD
jgi:DNA-binding transcriptional LysR family regulator